MRSVRAVLDLPAASSTYALAVAELTLADELLVLAVAAELNGWDLGTCGRPRIPRRMRYVVAGAELAELVLLGRLAPGGGRFVVVRRVPTGEPGLDAALERVADGADVARAVHDHAGTRPDERRLRRLHARQVILETEQRRGGILRGTPSPRWSAPEDGNEVRTLHAVRAALRSGTADRRTSMLLALVRASGLHRRWLRELPPREAARQLDRVTADGWLIAAITGAPMKFTALR